MKRLCVFVGIAALSGLLAGFPSAAQEQKKGEQPVDPKLLEALAKVELSQEEINSAYSLVDYGRRNKSPESILTAVEILRHHRPQPAKGKELGGPGDPKAQPPKYVLEFHLPELIQEARDMRPGDKLLAALADRTADALKEKTRGLADNPVAGLFMNVQTGGHNIQQRWTPGAGRVNAYVTRANPPIPTFFLPTRIGAGAPEGRSYNSVYMFLDITPQGSSTKLPTSVSVRKVPIGGKFNLRLNLFNNYEVGDRWSWTFTIPTEGYYDFKVRHNCTGNADIMIIANNPSSAP